MNLLRRWYQATFHNGPVTLEDFPLFNAIAHGMLIILISLAWLIWSLVL